MVPVELTYTLQPQSRVPVGACMGAAHSPHLYYQKEDHQVLSHLAEPQGLQALSQQDP